MRESKTHENTSIMIAVILRTLRGESGNGQGRSKVTP